jgi:hypothetical protein
MMLTENDIKSELSYAYLHSIATRAGCSVQVGNRHMDGAGVDAIVWARERFRPDSVFTDFSISVQLKATSSEPARDTTGHYPFPVSIDQYNKLRDTGWHAQQLLVVLFLPADPDRWVSHSGEALVSRRCAYWVSLRGAPPSLNRASQTIYIPDANLFSVAGLRAILTQVSLGERIHYEQPA